MTGLRPESWAVLGTAVLGIVAAIMAFIKTPPERRFRLQRLSLQEQVDASPPDARAAIIHADRRRALRRDLPWLAAALPMAGFALWLESTRVDTCATLLGVGRMEWLAWIFLALPLPVAVAGVMALRQAIAVLRGGYWPPLDTPVYVDTLARTGRMMRWRALGLLALMALIVAMLAYAYLQTLHFAESGQFRDRVQATEAACAQS